MKLTKAQVQIQSEATDAIRQVFLDAMEKGFPIGMKFHGRDHPGHGSYKIVGHRAPFGATIDEKGEVSDVFTRGWIIYRCLDKIGRVYGETKNYPMRAFWIAFEKAKD